MEFTERQTEIIEAAASRIDKHGIQNLTIKNLSADIGLSEPALYRHFKSKNDILLNLLDYFTAEMKGRLDCILIKSDISASDKLTAIFNSQFKAFTKKPAVISVIFSDGIFHFNKGLSDKVAGIMNLMRGYVNDNIGEGQKKGEYSNLINSSTLSTMIIGAVRLTVLQWKLSGHKSNLIENGNTVLSAFLSMIKR